MMIDTGLIADGLRSRGHVVDHVNKIAANGGNWEFVVDGAALTLDETRALMEADDVRASNTIGERGPLIGVPQEID